MGGNFVMDADGYIWNCRDGAVRKVDSKTGKIVQTISDQTLYPAPMAAR